MTTYYVEAYVPAKGALLADIGMTAAQVEQLRQAEREGRITDLLVIKDVDLAGTWDPRKLLNL